MYRFKGFTPLLSYAAPLYLRQITHVANSERASLRVRYTARSISSKPDKANSLPSTPIAYRDRQTGLVPCTGRVMYVLRRVIARMIRLALNRVAVSGVVASARMASVASPRIDIGIVNRLVSLNDDRMTWGQNDVPAGQSRTVHRQGQSYGQYSHDQMGSHGFSPFLSVPALFRRSSIPYGLHGEDSWCAPESTMQCPHDHFCKVHTP